MKTVTEHRAARAEHIAADQEVAAKALVRQIEYVDQIDKELVRFKVTSADRVETLRTKARAGLLAFVDVACDRCKTALFDRNPMVMLTSSPPKVWADCIGCGKDYALGMDMRVRKTF